MRKRKQISSSLYKGVDKSLDVMTDTLRRDLYIYLNSRISDDLWDIIYDQLEGHLTEQIATYYDYD